MSDPIDLTGDITDAITGASARGHALVLGYIDDDGYPSVSFRGSIQVLGPDRLGVWARKADQGLAAAIASRPEVSVLYYEIDGPGPAYLSIRGRAHVEPALDGQVYGGAPEGERAQDPDRAGVAVVIDVERVQGFRADGPFAQERAGG